MKLQDSTVFPYLGIELDTQSINNSFLQEIIFKIAMEDMCLFLMLEMLGISAVYDNSYPMVLVSASAMIMPSVRTSFNTLFGKINDFIYIIMIACKGICALVMYIYSFLIVPKKQ